MKDISQAAAALGKRGGSVTSDRKAAAARENGRKGGAPRTRCRKSDDSHVFSAVYSSKPKVCECGEMMDHPHLGIVRVGDH